MSTAGAGTAAPQRVAPTDSQDWDRFVKGHPQGDLVQTTAWGATKAPLGQTSAISVVRRDGVIAGGALIVSKPLSRHLGVGYVARGPLLEAEDPDLAAEVVSATLASASRAGIRVLIVSPTAEGAVTEELRRRRFAPGAPAPAPTATLQLDLTQPIDQILAGMTSMRRRYVRKSEREEIEVTEGDDLHLFHRLHTSSAERQGFAPMSLRYLEAQWDELRPLGAVTQYIASHQGRPAAAIWLTRFNGVVTYKLPAWAPDVAPRLHVNDALHWHTICQAKADGDHTYDFGGLDTGIAQLHLDGAPLPEEFRNTTGFFKLGFGGRPVLLAQPSVGCTSRAAHAALAPVTARILRSRRGRRAVKAVRTG